MPAQGARNPIQRTVVPVKLNRACAPCDRLNEAVLLLHVRLRLPCHHTAGCPGAVTPSVYTINRSVSSNRVAVCHTVTVTAPDVVVFPAPSRATAVRLWAPVATVVVSHNTEYGAAVTSTPRFAPSSLNCTPITPTLSLALAVTGTLPETVAPAAGEVIDTDGGVVSFDTVTVTPADVVWFPAASRATALRVWLPLAALVVFHDTEYGAAVTSAPRLAPSSLNCTPATPTLSLALAVTGTVPETVAPAAGEVIDTEGGVVSFDTVTVTPAEVVTLPAASR